MVRVTHLLDRDLLLALDAWCQQAALQSDLDLLEVEDLELAWLKKAVDLR
jgi:hypothetical protein